MPLLKGSENLSIVNVEDYIQGEDIYTTMGDTKDADMDFDTYVFPADQDYIRVANEGDFDLLLRVGGYRHTIIHPGDTFEGETSFRSFDIRAITDDKKDDCQFTFVAKEYGSTNVDVAKWFDVALRGHQAAAGIKLTSTNKTTSAATINAATGGQAKKYEVEFTITMKDSGGTTTQEWFNGNFEVSVETDSAAGKVATDVPVLTLLAGVGKIKLVYTGTFAQGDVNILTIHSRNVNGRTIAEHKPKDTLT